MRTSLGAGILVILPLVVTFVILKFLFDAFDPIIKDLIDEFAPRYAFPGMGIAGLAIIIYLVGLITTHILGRRLIAFGHGIVDLVPVVRGIYRTARQATHVLSTVAEGSAGKYSAVVFIEFPGYGLRSIGLVTAKMKDENDATLLAVYCPTSPFPTSGFLCIIPEDRVTYTDLPVEDAMKLIVSAGIASPDSIKTGPLTFGGIPWTTDNGPMPERADTVQPTAEETGLGSDQSPEEDRQQ